jgi:hypothetical protein
MAALMTGGIIPGSFFTPEQWRGPMAPYVDDLFSKPGGLLLISVTVEPERRNYPSVAFGVFDATERKSLRTALEKARRKRQKLHDVDRDDAASSGEGKDSGSLEVNVSAQTHEQPGAMGAGVRNLLGRHIPVRLPDLSMKVYEPHFFKCLHSFKLYNRKTQ